MSVQATIALLNKNAFTNTVATTNTSTTNLLAAAANVTPFASKSARVSSTWKDVGCKQRRSSSDKSSRVAELERIRSSSNGGVASILSKFVCPESPPATMSKKPTVRPNSSNTFSDSQTVRHSVCRTRIDAILADLIEMHERAVEEAERARGDHQSVSGKSRDYEERIQYLSKKLDEVVCERDNLVMQLSNVQDPKMGPNECHCQRQNIRKSVSLLAPHDTKNNSSETCNEDISEISSINSDEELHFVKEQLSSLERGTKTIFERQAKDLEIGRKQIRTLMEVVHKQEKLIMSLEIKLSSSRFDKDCLLLLQDQLELQQMELDDKHNLLLRLLDERGGDHTRHHRPIYSLGCSSSTPTGSECGTVGRRSTSSRASTPSLQTSSARSSYVNTGLLSLGRSTTPFASPPRDPLPHAPFTASATTKHIPRGSYISSSLSSTSLLSQSTSWSSAEYAMMRPGDKATNVSIPMTDAELHQWTDYTPVHVFPTPSKTDCRQPSSRFTLKRNSSNNHNSAAFWKGWKHRLSARQ